MIRHDITIVSGLPRSGTSMVMRMLTAGGLPALCDQVRAADEDNPLGYFEYEPVKELRVRADWLPQAEGKCVKVVSHFLEYLPDSHRYAVIFIERDIDEVLMSQARMLTRRGFGPSAPDPALRATFNRHLDQVHRQLADSARFRHLRLSYREVVANPGAAAQAVERFLTLGLDVEAMAAVVDASLHRNRSVPATTP